jgi:hypothetical protein
MPSSPRTPTHSRRPSNIDLSFATSYSGGSSSRRHSKASIHSPSPTTPLRLSHTRTNSTGIEEFGSGGGPAANGLGNLADELAEAWDDDEADEEPDMNFQGMPADLETTKDSGVDVTELPAKNETKAVNLTPPTNGKNYRRHGSDYDGSDYGDDSDMDSPGMPPGLVAKMDIVESLARRGTEANGSERDGVVKRVVDGLRDLGSQSGVEGGATRYPTCSFPKSFFHLLTPHRLITAHTALSTHLLHQTRLLHSLTYPLFSPLSAPPDPEFIDDLLPLLLTISESMPRPTSSAFTSITTLHSLTADLVSSLSYLSDTLHMSRQTTTTATRRLKSARELVAEMRREEEAREEGERWLRRGNWGERLGARECAGVCGEVVGGFEEVCNGWRARLVAQAEAIGA